MSKKSPAYKIPFVRKSGNLLHYANQHSSDEVVVWEDNFEFADTLEIKDMARGRGAAYFVWTSTTTGKNYPMFMTDMVDLVTKGVVDKGLAAQTWTFQKRGQNYGIRAVFPKR